MKQGFMSIDGKFFTSEAKCKEHEVSIGFFMYGSNGITSDPAQAFGVSILSETGYEDFCSICNKCDSSYRGLDGIGDWLWDSDRDIYIRLEYNIFKALVRMYNDKYGSIEK